MGVNIICCMFRLFLTVVTCFCSCLSIQAGSISPQTEIRDELVLKVGSAAISRYAVQKNVTRFRAADKTASEPSGDVVRKWFQRYLARQLMIAEALKQGYGRRVEVLQIVEAMARQTLVQSELTPVAPTDIELRTAFEKVPTPIGHSKPSFEELRPTLQRTLLQTQKAALVSAQRDQALQAAGLAISLEVAEKVIHRLDAKPADAKKIPVEQLAPFGEEIVATYRNDEEMVKFTVEAWRQRFNQLFARTRPTDTKQLEKCIQDMV